MTGKVAIAEDVTMFRDLAVTLCEREGLRVAGATESGGHAVSLCMGERPDVLLLDLQLKGLNGFDVMEELVKAKCPTRILIVSAYLEDFVVYRIERSAAVGYVDKGTEHPQTITEAIEVILRGGRWFAQSFRTAQLRRRRNPIAFDKLLSDGQIRFLTLAAQGTSDLQIAQDLGISVRTAEGIRRKVLKKLGLGSTRELMSFAMDNGFRFFPPRSSSEKIVA